MHLKVPKCLALAFACRDKQGCCEWGCFDPQLSVGGQPIPVMGPEGFKYLGRRLDPSLSEDGVKAFLRDSLLRWMRLVDNTPLLGSMKCWIYDAFVIPKLSWFFTIQNLSVSFVKASLHTLVLPFLKRWCGLPKGGNTAILFCGPPTALGLALKPVYTVYKACQVVRRGILQRSRDPTVRLVFELELARQSTWSGPRFAAARELSSVQALATDIEVHPHHQGLGYVGPVRGPLPRCPACRYFHALDSEELLSKADSLVMQGKIRSLHDLSRGDWSWSRLLHGYSEGLFRFKINATNNSLPTGDNLRRWTPEHLATQCSGCARAGPTLRHVLNGCPTFLMQGRYKWRHDQVLRVIFDSVASFVSHLEPPRMSTSWDFISFVPEGVGLSRGPQALLGPLPRRPLSSGLLGGIFDWQLMGDGISECYCFPPEVAVTSFRPDLVLVSPSARSCILIELTVPFEDRVSVAAELKSKKYQELRREIISNGYACHLYTVEVGCRGNHTGSLRSCLSKLGLASRAVASTCRLAAYAALRCSYYIYLCRRRSVWQV